MALGNIDDVRKALVSMESAFVDLLDKLVRLDALAVEDQLAIAQQLEVMRNRWTAIDVRVLTGLDRADAAGAWCQGNMRRVLTSTLGLSKAEAGRRVHAYEQLGPRRTELGQELGPIRPLLAEAVAAGEVSAEKAAIISRGLKTVDRVGFDPADIAVGEKLLVDDAKLFPPEELKILTQRVVDTIDPDGSRPDDQRQYDRRHLELHPTRDGGYAGRFRLTAGCGAKLIALLRPLSRIRVDDPYGDGASGDRTGEQVSARALKVDERTFGQRQHDALEECCNRLMREGSVHENHAPVTLIVTVDETDLKNRSGHATTTSGALIATGTALEVADQAEIYTAVLDSKGVPLRMGRTKRCATRHQTMALIARDIGCSFPGCRQSAEYCERHHVVPWADGGSTDLDNLTLLCIYHHHNFLQRGWIITMNADGIPEWRPPTWVDPTQKPLINSRIVAARRTRERSGPDSGQQRRSAGALVRDAPPVAPALPPSDPE